MVLPVQVINAGIEKNSLELSVMQASTATAMQNKHDCMHAQPAENMVLTEMPCCEDTFNAHQCEGCASCGDCTHVSSTAFLPLLNSMNLLATGSQKNIVNHLEINGISQENPIRPPRLFI